MEGKDDEDSGDLSDAALVDPATKYVLTSEEMLATGLRALKWEEAALKRASHNLNCERFRGHFGADPHVIASLWSDLIHHPDETKRVDPSEHPVEHLLIAMHFLKRYNTDIERNTTWKINEESLREMTWFFVEKIGGILQDVVKWPKDNFGDLIWVMSVDGTHIRTNEPNHPDFPKDTSAFSHKHKCAGFNYEIGLSLHKSELIWFRGPYKAGTWNDVKIFKEKGLRYRLQKYKKMAIADHGYRGYRNVISTNNSHDNKYVRRFKIRARQRHETYNRKLKEFECLGSKFRHGEERLADCFNAVVVVVQYKMRMGSPLWII